jgi:hypothetical protein
VTEFDPTGRVPWVMRVKTRSSSPSKAAVGFVKSASDKVGISSETKSASDKVGKIIMEADPLIRKDLTLNFVMQFPRRDRIFEPPTMLLFIFLKTVKFFLSTSP